MPAASLARQKTYERQADGVVAEAPPVSGTPYALLAASADVMVEALAVMVTWTVQPTPLEMRVTIDGQVITFTVANPVSATWYYPELNAELAPAAQVLQVTDHSIGRAFLFKGKSIAVEVETTGGTVSNLDARIKYSQLT